MSVNKATSGLIFKMTDVQLSPVGKLEEILCCVENQLHLCSFARVGA